MKYLKLFEEFNNRDEILKWMYDNNIIKSGEILDRSGIKKLLYHLIENNESLIKKTALKNCHARGLNSFILNSSPKIRLFISDEDCEIRNIDPYNPIIPIHPHKYDDLFFQINGKLIHHIYHVSNSGVEFNKYNFIRLNNIDSEIINLGKEKLRYVGNFSNINKLRSKTLHTASVEGDCSWIIIETKPDDNFNEIFYHQNLQKRNYLYQKFDDPISYLYDFVDKI